MTLTMIIMLVMLLILMLLGVSTAASLGIISIGTFFIFGQTQNLTMLAQRMYASSTGITLLAIPFFILMGNIMNKGGISTRLFAFAKALVGHWWGGLAQASVVALSIVSGMSGAAVSDAAGVGLVAIPEMKKAGYGSKFPAAIIGAGATLGPIIPPSIAFVVYSSITGVSVGKLFLAGFPAGFVIMLALMTVIHFVAKKRNYPRSSRTSLSEIWKAFKDAFLSLMAVVIVLGGMFSGIFTATEAAVVAALYAAVLGFFVYKEVKIKDMPQIIWDTIGFSVKVLYIIAIAGFFSYVLMQQRIPQAAIYALTSLTTNPVLIILIITFILLLLGCFLEGTAIILITTPILMPLLLSMGYDPLQYGVFLVLLTNIGLLTPPVGMNLYTVTAISGENMWVIARESIPYMIALLGVALLIGFVPEITTYIPSFIK